MRQLQLPRPDCNLRRGRSHDKACAAASEAGAKRALKLKVGGGFHSPCMEPARAELAEAIEATEFHTPFARYIRMWTPSLTPTPPKSRPTSLAQLTAPVRWTQSVRNMVADGATEFVELGPGKVLQGLVAKIERGMAVSGKQ